MRWKWKDHWAGKVEESSLCKEAGERQQYNVVVGNHCENLLHGFEESRPRSASLVASLVPVIWLSGQGGCSQGPTPVKVSQLSVVPLVPSVSGAERFPRRERFTAKMAVSRLRCAFILSFGATTSPSRGWESISTFVELTMREFFSMFQNQPALGLNSSLDRSCNLHIIIQVYIIMNDSPSFLFLSLAAGNH